MFKQRAYYSNLILEQKHFRALHVLFPLLLPSHPRCHPPYKRPAVPGCPVPVEYPAVGSSPDTSVERGQGVFVPVLY